MTAALALRPATPDDAVAVTAVLTASYGTLFQGWYAPDHLAAMLPELTAANPALLASGRFHIVERAGVVIACGGWSVLPPTGVADPGSGHVRHVATHPEHTRLGAARRILEACVAEARTAGLGGLDCFASLPSERFYRACGFARRYPVTLPLRSGLPMPAILMHRRLDGT